MESSLSMSGFCGSLQLCCAICRIGCYTICRRLCCCIGPPSARPEYSVICLGFAGSGKSTLLALLSGETTEGLQPTVGFSIKAVQFNDCIVNVKEVGGGENVRPYWKHYFSDTQGIIFVVNSACHEFELETVKTELSNVLANPMLQKLPLLILASHQDKEDARKKEQLIQFLELEKHGEGREWLVHPCSYKDLKAVRSGFEQFNKLVIAHSTPVDSTDIELQRI